VAFVATAFKLFFSSIFFVQQTVCLIHSSQAQLRSLNRKKTDYSHVVSKQRTQQITRAIRKKKSSAESAAMQDDAFMAEAMRRYKAGELSDDAFLEIAKSHKA